MNTDTEKRSEIPGVHIDDTLTLDGILPDDRDVYERDPTGEEDEKHVR